MVSWINLYIVIKKCQFIGIWLMVLFDSQPPYLTRKGKGQQSIILNMYMLLRFFFFCFPFLWGKAGGDRDSCIIIQLFQYKMENKSLIFKYEIKDSHLSLKNRGYFWSLVFIIVHLSLFNAVLEFELSNHESKK